MATGTRAVATTKSCKQCGKPFEPHRNGRQKYCSAKCKQAHYWQSDGGRKTHEDYLRTHRAEQNEWRRRWREKRRPPLVVFRNGKLLSHIVGKG